MIVKQVNLLVLASLCCLASSAPQVYYVIPTQPDPQGSCHVNGTTLSPCYTLQQLNGVLSSSNGSVEVLLYILPGTHLIPENETLNISNFSEVVIRPWKEELEIVIECVPIYSTNILFQDIIELKILSMRFSSCKLQYSYEMNNKTERSVNITKTVFEKSTINMRSTEPNLNVTISNCTFSLSNKIRLAYTLDDDTSTPNFGLGRITIGNLLITNTLFQDNAITYNYGVLDVVYTNLMIRNCHFINNSVLHYSDSNCYTIYAAFSFLTLTNTTFQHSRMGSLSLSFSSGTIDSCLFLNNSSTYKRIIVEIHDSLLSINDSIFEENKCTALYMNTDKLLLKISNCTFRNNSGGRGGAVYVENSYFVDIINSSFSFNKAEVGGAIYCVNSIITSKGLMYSFSNSAEYGGYVYASSCRLYFDHHHTTITNNIANKNGGALYLDESKVTIFYAYLILSNNVAKENGGAIFIPDNYCGSITPMSSCFIHFYGQFIPPGPPVLLIFTNNTALQGPVIYGGLLDRCHINIGHFNVGIKSISSYEDTAEAITSDPVRICLCTENHELDCTNRSLTVSDKSTGQTITLLGTVVDQDKNPKESYIRAGYSETTTELGKGEERRKTGNNCSKLSYHFFTRKTSATLILRPEGSCESSTFSSVFVYIKVKSCPRGFEQNEDTCGCDKRLSNRFKGIDCDINADTIAKTKESTSWLRYDENYLKVQGNCPLDYCNATSDNISLGSPDEQCANNRGGVICGSCQDNFSVGLGGSKCLQCTSNSPLIWLIPVFAVAGVALVALLLVCNMTISHGTLNGLIFYANVVSITRLTSLQSCSIHPILSVFIAWLNLDFGVETCFYSGMDTYQKTWLQFAFPLYIWLLVGAIIVVSHYSFTAVKVFGRNNIAILATLFLLSYTKILKTIITALNFTQVFKGSANDTSDPLVPYYVWTYDGNIEYLKGKHVALFAVALVFLVFLFLPYTLLLMFGQCIRSIQTQRRCVLWFLDSAAFVSIMDAYHAPYNNRHRYWTGLMLLSRCVLFLAFSFNYNDNGLLANMYITTLVLIGILTIKTCITKVYKNSLVNRLEICFLLNLVILSGTIYYLGYSDNTCICTSASISVSMVISAGILAYHTSLQLNKTRRFNSIKDSILAKWRKHYHKLPADPEEEDAPPAHPAQRLPTRMVVELREELLTDQH